MLKTIGRAVWTGTKIILKTALLLPVPAFMVFFNFKVDRSGLFHGDRYNRELAQAIIAGNNLNEYDKIDERGVLDLIAQNIEQPYDTIVLGSSRALMLQQKTAGTASFMNGGVSGADFRDVLGGYYLFDRAGKTPKHLILVLDPWLLSAQSSVQSPRADVNLYNEFLNEKLGISAEFTPEDMDAKYRALLSPSYFQGNIKYYFRDTSGEEKPMLAEGDIYSHADNIKLADGSVFYGTRYRNVGDDVIADRVLADINSFEIMKGYRTPEKELCDIFTSFIAYVQGQGVEISFLLEPYHPLVYTWAHEHEQGLEGFFEAEEWYRKCAAGFGIPVYGSYNPFVMGFWGSDFYDGLHPKQEAVEKIYPGVLAAEKGQGAGEAGKAFGGAEVTWQTASRLVAERYEIEPPHVIKQGENEIINGESCMLALRYDRDFDEDMSEEEREELFSQDEVPVLLAQYAVSASGVVYRLDTDLEEWVEDLRFPEV